MEECLQKEARTLIIKCCKLVGAHLQLQNNLKKTNNIRKGYNTFSKLKNVKSEKKKTKHVPKLANNRKSTI